MATESNRDKARRGGWGTGEVLSVGFNVSLGGVPDPVSGAKPGGLDKRGLDLTVNPRDTLFVGKTAAHDTLTFQACAASLRALHDAIGQALEVGTGRVAAFGDGRWSGAPLVVCRNEMLFAPKVGMDVAAQPAAAPSTPTRATCASSARPSRKRWPSAAPASANGARAARSPSSAWAVPW